MAYFYLGVAILCEVVGTTALKLSNGFTLPLPSLVTVIGYAAAFYLLALCLRSLSVGFTYAIWAGVGIVLVGGLEFFSWERRRTCQDWSGLA